MNPKFTCQNCKKRKLGCHSRCVEYRAWKEKREQETRWLKQNRAALLQLECSIKQIQFT